MMKVLSCQRISLCNGTRGQQMKNLMHVPSEKLNLNTERLIFHKMPDLQKTDNIGI